MHALPTRLQIPYDNNEKDPHAPPHAPWHLRPLPHLRQHMHPPPKLIPHAHAMSSSVVTTITIGTITPKVANHQAIKNLTMTRDCFQ